MTPQQKLDKKARDSLDKLIKVARVQWSMGQIKTLGHLLHLFGRTHGYFPSELEQLITYDDVKSYFQDRHIELEASIQNRSIHVSTPQEVQTIKETTDEILAGLKEAQEQALSSVPTEQEEEQQFGFQESPNENVFLYKHQKKATVEILTGITIKQHHSKLLLAAAGVGKTFILGAVVRRLIDMEWHKQVGSISPWPYVYVTKASIVEKTKRDLKNYFNLGPRDILVINIDQLRSKAGELWIDEKIIVENGVERSSYTWRPFIHPALIIWDECQVLKNPSSTQHKIGAAFNDIPEDNTYQIFSSATPFTRVSEAKCFAVGTRLPNAVMGGELNNQNWGTFSQDVAYPANPEEHSPVAVDRFIDKLDAFIVRVKNVHPQFHAKNVVQTIAFSTEEGEEYYNQAESKYLKKKAKLAAQADAGLITAGQANINKLVAMLMYRIAAEGNPDRIRYIGTEMFRAVEQGFAAVGAFNFKGSIIKLTKFMIETMGISRDDISIIWGGGRTSVSKKAENKAAITGNADIMAALEAAGITLEDLELDDVEAAKEDEQFPPEYRLGVQTLQERQREIDRFQKGITKYCFYTFRAGGVGLSLHHSDELTTEWNQDIEGYGDFLKEIGEWNRHRKDEKHVKPGKCRKKESGYAFESDIKFIPTRPRKSWIAPTWSAIELVQGLGRAPRLTSLSDTEQFLIFFKGTIEEKVAAIVRLKLRCLSKIVRQKEDWDDVVDKSPQYIENKYMNPAENLPDTEEEFVSAGSPEDEEDN